MSTLHGKGAKSLRVGTGNDYFDLDTTGVATMVGAAKRSLTLRPALQFAELVRVGASTDIRPTPVELGAFTGYSMPVYNNDYEELYYKMRVPYRWDGTSNPYFKMMVALSGNEDVGDKFKFTLDWNNTSVTGAITTTYVTVPTETTIITDHTDQYDTYSVSFELDYDNASLQQTMVARNNLVGRVRRVAASGSEVSNEIIVVDWVTTWQVDKIFGVF